ncbi:MAG: 2-hydroxyacid dehydrogenase [Neisseriaceae bacterium]
MKIAIFSTHKFDKKYFNLHNIYNLEFTFIENTINQDSLKLAQKHDAICVFANDKVDQTIIAILSDMNIKLIALRSAGFDNIDLLSAKQYNIPVVRVPAYSPYSVAEHAVAMILTLNRKTHKAYNQVKERNFTLDNLLGFDLFGKTVGIIGCGKIGSAFAKIMLGFGCNVMIYDPYINDKIVAFGAKYINLEKLLNISDIISLHCPLTENNFHLINSETIYQMKQGVCLINTGRGGLINTVDVKNAILNSKIGLLGLDVYEHEKDIFFKDLSNNVINDLIILELLMFPNVLITSHQGFFTHEALTKIATTTIENIYKFFTGKIQNQITI